MAQKYFPEIIVNKKGKDFEGTACLKLKSILKGNLLTWQSDASDDTSVQSTSLGPKKLHMARETLLHAISSWPSSLSLELHFTALPDLIHRAQGQILISLFLRAYAATKDDVKEEIVCRYLSLVPLLSAYLPEAEFEPVSDKTELNRRRAPFKTSDSVAILRRQETFSLASPLKRVSVGFGPMVEKTIEGANWVDHIFPWIPSMDDWLRLMDMFMLQLDPVQLVIRICPDADTEDSVARLEHNVRTSELFLSEAKASQITSRQQTKFVRDVTLKQLAGLRNNCFRVGVFLLAPRAIDSSLINIIGKAVTGPQYNPKEEDLFQGGFSSIKIKPRDAVKRDFFPEKEPLTISETACAFRIPSPPLEEHPGLPVKRSRTSVAFLPTVNLQENSGNNIELLVNEHHGVVQPVRVGSNDRMRHTFIIGQTGTGKSSAMERMILQDIRSGKGLAVIDPHGDMVDSVLGRIPAERTEDVILFNMLDTERPLGFNLLEWKTPEERDLIIDELYLSLDRIYNLNKVGGPIFESNFRGIAKIVMGGKTKR